MSLAEDEQICSICGESCTTGEESGGQVICVPCLESMEDFALAEEEKDAEFDGFLEYNDLDGLDLDSGEFY